MTVADELFYVRQLSPRLKLFRQTQRHHFLFRCPICGDSEVNDYKTRGSIYPRGDHMMYGCFNCGTSVRFTTFLKDFDPLLFKDYLFEKFKDSKKTLEWEEPEAETIATDNDIPKLLGLNNVFPVSVSSKGKEYLKSRFIIDFSDIYFTNDAMEIIAKFRPETKNVHNFKDKEAIVFPLMTIERAVYGVQLRFLEGDFRYMSIMVDTRFAKMFGSHHVDLKEDMWVTEGIFDMYMFDNAVANLDSALHTIADKMKLQRSQFVLMFDNEPRNKEIMKMMSKGVDFGYRVFFWPREAGEIGKDLNDIRKNNNEYFDRLMSAKDVYVKSGLHAKLEMKKFLNLS